MSFWGATVITNLLSAIPVFGQDLVELNLFNYIATILFKNIEITFSSNFESMCVLPTIGTVYRAALKNGNKIRTEKINYLSIPSEFIAFFTGLIDGDGYICINETTKGYISLKLVLTLNIEDLATLNYIHSIFKFGRITTYKNYKNPICKLIINKTDLQEVVFPLLKYYNIFFLTSTRRKQFNLAMYILIMDIKKFKDIPSDYKVDIRENSVKGLNNNKEFIFTPLSLAPYEYLKLSFFQN
jgi:hypothetical protein